VVSQAAEIVAEDVRLVVSVDESIFAGLDRDEAGVDVTGAANVLLRRLSHERHGQPVPMRDLLDAVLVDRVAVGRGDRVRVAHVKLVLPVPRLALGELHWDAGTLHPEPNLAHEALVARRRKDVVVHDVRDRRREVAVALRRRVLEAVAVEIELEL
jgi:hypothetical protein